MVVPDSYGVSRVPHYLEIRSNLTILFHLQGYHLLWLNFPDYSVIEWFFDKSPDLYIGPTGLRYPLPATHTGYHTGKVWALPRSLAATEGINIFFCSSGY